jgi:hypothetical protein
MGLGGTLIWPPKSPDLKQVPVSCLCTELIKDTLGLPLGIFQVVESIPSGVATELDYPGLIKRCTHPAI